MRTFEYRARVYFSDTDAGGIAYHARYLDWAEHGRTEMLREIYPGKSQSQLVREDHLMIVVKSISIEYRTPAFLDDEITVLTELADIQHVSCTIRQSIMRGDTLLSQLMVRVAFIDSETKRPRKIPEDIARTFEQAKRGGVGFPFLDK